MFSSAAGTLCPVPCMHSDRLFPEGRHSIMLQDPKLHASCLHCRSTGNRPSSWATTNVISFYALSSLSLPITKIMQDNPHLSSSLQYRKMILGLTGWYLNPCPPPCCIPLDQILHSLETSPHGGSQCSSTYITSCTFDTGHSWRGSINILLTALSL